MAESILKIHTQNGDIPVGYPGLADKPIADKTLSVEGAFADSKAVGDRFKEVNAETDSLKEDIGKLSSSKISKFYATNIGENHLADSDDGKITDMLVYGRSEQKSTTGAQLINTFEFKAINGVLTIDEDGVVTLTNNIIDDVSGIEFNLSTLENSQYTFKNYSNVGYYVMLDRVDYSHLIQPNNSFTFTKTDFLKILGANIQAGKSANFKCMLEKGSEAHAYEPYTGGQPSPSPDYPQEIKSVVNPTVKVVGKNLWDNFKTLSLGNVEQKNGTYIATTNTMQVDVTDASVGFRPLPLKANNSYTFSFKTTVSISNFRFICLRYTNGENNNIVLQNKNFVNFIPERDVEKIGFILYGSVAGDKVYDVQLEMGSEATSYEPYHEQTVTLPYTLNAIPVESGGNVVIDGQQYIADYVDVERGKVIRNILKWRLADFKTGFNNRVWHMNIFPLGIDGSKIGLSNIFRIQNSNYPNPTISELYISVDGKEASLNMRGMTDEEFKKWLSEKNPEVYNVLTVAEEIPITLEEASAFKELMTYYPVTNISVNSEQLDGYTVFNYPISMANGWNYVKKQLNDNRDYIYDMDTRTQDIDTQAAEAYVNSEYAVALTELEV